MSARWVEAYERQLNQLNHQILEMPQVNRNEATIYVHEAVTKIQKEVEYLSQRYDFKHRFQLPGNMIDDSLFVRCVKRVIKFRFKCKNPYCQQFKKRTSRQQRSYEIQRSWTSYNGLVEFKFYFNNLTPDLSLRPELVYSLRLYKQKCLKCKQQGKTGFIESILEKVIELYKLLILNCMVMRSRVEDIQWGSKQKTGDVDQYTRQQYQNILRTNHIRDLCEACYLKVCMRFYQEKETGFRQSARRKRAPNPKRRRRR